ncbi:toprim domain-containing protein [Desulfurobacterium indicum]|uniref:Toprim domain-containing protein n=1 Tax=Desulfurobacterium indicum TaxID=1914305 RepID=A0A1R1MMU6_9BACT|nr:toprim domain-containing protein [Desulfurobacterium indicum]OMH41083.1 hypothetical protein BLW93_01825 [Desulfurobacterium indicum]
MEREKQRKLKLWLMELKNFINRTENTIIVVEGKRDKIALKKFGIDRVYPLKGKGFHDFAQILSDEIKPQSIILITDFDPEGEIIFQKLQKIFSRYNLPIDTSFREELRKTGIKFVEEIPKRIFK